MRASIGVYLVRLCFVRAGWLYFAWCFVWFVFGVVWWGVFVFSGLWGFVFSRYCFHVEVWVFLHCGGLWVSCMLCVVWGLPVG